MLATTQKICVASVTDRGVSTNAPPDVKRPSRTPEILCSGRRTTRLPHCRRDRKEKSEYQDRPGRRNAQDHGDIICQRLKRLVAMVDPNPCRFKKCREKA